MRRENLGRWLIVLSQVTDEKQVAEGQARARQILNKTEGWLAFPPTKRYVPDETGLNHYASHTLAPEEVERAQQLYPPLMERGGTGTKAAQEALLHLIAQSGSLASVPFWLSVLDLSKPRDPFRTERREMALAALAFLAIKYEGKEQAPYEALRQAAQHPDADVRALAVHHLGNSYYRASDLTATDEEERIHRILYPPLTPEQASERGSIPSEVLALLRRIATEDEGFEPRFQARQLLFLAGEEVPLDHPDGVYAFKVWLIGNKQLSRTVELRSTQTLETLHQAIQRAIKWDSDHLYSFFLNGKAWDERYGYASPFEQDAHRSVDEVLIGELGLVVGHTFLYLFDYGASHSFEVEVVAIHEHAEEGDYPRVVESKGRAPTQYAW